MALLCTIEGLQGVLEERFRSWAGVGSSGLVLTEAAPKVEPAPRRALKVQPPVPRGSLHSSGEITCARNASRGGREITHTHTHKHTHTHLREKERHTHKHTNAQRERGGGRERE
eukprot:421975-Pleurochrysis_carterae.AAC.1